MAVFPVGEGDATAAMSEFEGFTIYAAFQIAGGIHQPLTLSRQPSVTCTIFFL